MGDSRERYNIQDAGIDSAFNFPFYSVHRTPYESPQCNFVPQAEKSEHMFSVWCSLYPRL